MTTMCIHYVVHLLPFVPLRDTHRAVVAQQYVPAAESRSSSGLFYRTRYHYETILVTACSMVWDWRFFGAGSILRCWPELPAPYCLPLFSLPSFYGLALWGLGHRTYKVHPLSPSLAMATFADNNIE